MTNIDLDTLSWVVGGSDFACRRGEALLPCLRRNPGLSSSGGYPVFDRAKGAWVMRNANYPRYEQAE